MKCAVTCDTHIVVAALYNLEEDWRDLVDQSAALPERVQHQQTAVWELVHTEVAYIHTLKVVTDVSALTDNQTLYQCFSIPGLHRKLQTLP